MDVPDEETLEDVNGVKRKTMHDTWRSPRLRARSVGEMVMVIHSGGLGHLPFGYVKIAIENDHRNSGFSH